jgi:hypothetical protein
VLRPALIPAATMLALAAAGCGGGGGSRSGATTAAGGSATAAVRKAVQRTAAAGSEHVVLGAHVGASGQQVSLTGNGDFDSHAHRGTVHATVSLGGSSFPVDEVLDGGTAYVSSSFFSSFLPKGKKWLKIDLSSAGGTFGAGANALTAPADPTVMLGWLKALADVQETGSATIDGTQTTEYRGRIDPAKLPAAAATGARNSHARFGPVQIWIGDGYVRQLRASTTASTGGQQAATVVTLTLSQFGEKVSVTAPPASGTVDASKMQIPGFGTQGA